MAAAAPTGQPSGNHQISLAFNTTIPPSTSNTTTGTVISSYNVPVNISYTQAYTYYGVTSAPTASTISKAMEIVFYNTSGTHTIDLSAQKCTDWTDGVHYVREVFIFNDATTATYTMTYKLDGATPFIEPFVTGVTSGVLTGATITINPGSYFHAGNPLYATGGWDASTNKNMVFDHGANTFTSRVVIIGGY